MSISFKEAVGVHADALQLRADRTRVLASNIANENTPGFQARDIDFGTMLQQLQDAPGESAGGEEAQALYRVPYHPSRDGNTVEIGVEQAAFSQNSSDFQTSLTFASMKFKGMARAIAGQ